VGLLETSGVVGGEAAIGEPGAGDARKLALRFPEKSLEPPEDPSGPGVLGVFGVRLKKDERCGRIGGCEGDAGCGEGH
jgi:hypothetical protein